MTRTTRRTALLLPVVVAALAWGATPVLADTSRQLVFTSIGADEMIEILDDAGHGPTLDEDEYGDPEIEATTHDVRYYVEFYECDGEAPPQCGSILFQIGFSTDDTFSTDLVNDWNREERYTRAYVDNDGDPIMEMDVSVDGGLARGNLRTLVDYWDGAVEKFVDHIDW